MARMENGRIVETAVEARGAERGPTVRNVLLAGTALVMAGLRDRLHRVFRRRSNNGTRTSALAYRRADTGDPSSVAVFRPLILCRRKCRLAWRPEDYAAIFSNPNCNRRIAWSPKRERQAH